MIPKNRNEGKLLFLSFLFLALVLFAAYQFIVAPISVNINEFLAARKESQTLQQYISTGDKILVLANTNYHKQAAVQAFAQDDFATAYNLFKLSLKSHPNDPESLVYSNNSAALVSSKSTVKIVVSVPIGSNLNVASEILRGVAMAQNEINQKGGVNNHKPLLVQIANDNNDPALAKKLASYFVSDANLLAAVAYNASNASVAACPIYQQGKLVMISPTSFSVQLSECGEYIFRTVPSIRSAAEQLAHYALKTARKTRIVVCSDYEALDNRSFKNEFNWVFNSRGGEMVNTECNLSAPNFNPSVAISQAISAGADSLLLGPHIDRINKAIEVTRANKGRLAIFGGPTLYTFQTLQSGQSDVNGMVLAVPWHPKQGDRFVVNASKLWGAAVSSWRSATSYDAVLAVVEGLKLQHNSTRENLQQILHSPSFSIVGATGKIHFLPSGDRHLEASLVQVQPGNISSTGYDFVSRSP